MKKLFYLFILALMNISIFAQTPNSFKYQAVVRTAEGVVMQNQDVGLQMTILQGSASGTTAYQETFSETTNSFGLVNVEIGTGDNQVGLVSDIDWSNGPFFIETAIDLTGGTSYEVMGTSQLLSVPYALHANTVNADNICDLFSYYYADIDGDNFGNQINVVFSCSQPEGYVSDNTDCDDGDIAINPAAEEICDGIDNNCNGEIDEGLTTYLFYADTDSDGFGDTDVSIESCSQPEGYVSDNTDCDDSNPNVNPGAEEICDGIDNNCYGGIDEDLIFLMYYLDYDGDGYGDTDNSLEECSQPQGYVLDNTDCDDSNPNVNPGAEEVCNGIDDNCNGGIDDELLPETCENTNQYGTCVGMYECMGDQGWVCDADMPVEEMCNGVDDNCNGEIDEGYTDTDGDGDADCIDEDDDDDDILDIDDNCPLVFNPEQTDTDGDGIGDACEICYTDSDCEEGYICIGGECVQNCLPDCAGAVCGDDGCGGSCGTCGDGDACSSGNCLPDLDGDGIADVDDPDIDGDGVLNNVDCDPYDPNVNVTIGSPCDDNDACTVGDVIDENCNCVGTPIVCDDGNACTDDYCDPVTGMCNFTVAGNGTSCDDGNPCTTNDHCESGFCTGDPIDCDDGNPCTIDYCDPVLGCVHEPVSEGTECDDGDPCTINDRCQGGICMGDPIDCDDGDPNTIDSCDPATGACIHTPVK